MNNNQGEDTFKVQKISNFFPSKIKKPREKREIFARVTKIINHYKVKTIGEDGIERIAHLKKHLSRKANLKKGDLTIIKLSIRKKYCKIIWKYLEFEISLLMKDKKFFIFHVFSLSLYGIVE